MDVLSLGEVMVQLNSFSKGPLRHANLFERHVAGSESNVIIGMSRLGLSCGFLTAVGNDEFGKSVISTLRSENVDIRGIKINNELPTAVYFVQRGFPVPGKTDVVYYRKGSAFSALMPDDIDPTCFQDLKLFHVSGITPALSKNCKDSALRAIELAKNNGALISFDTNIRKKLLPNPEIAKECLTAFISRADYLITGKADLDYIFPDLTLNEQLDALKKIDPKNKMIVLKMGKEGSSLYVEGNFFHFDGYKTEVVDEMGAGDAFDAAFLSLMLLGKDFQTAMNFANAAGALVVGSKGDMEPLPNLEELETFLSFQEKGENKIMR